VKLLLDTCTFLWVVTDDPQLSATARALVADAGNAVYLSVASAWEIVVKHQLGRLPLPDDPEALVPFERERHRIDPLDIDEVAMLNLSRLPPLHRDPVDRMLVSQAIVAGLAIVTPDRLIRQYPVRVLW
jgi:PIN domain nuclease of toxin-antitoxin system